MKKILSLLSSCLLLISSSSVTSCLNDDETILCLDNKLNNSYFNNWNWSNFKIFLNSNSDYDIKQNIVIKNDGYYFLQTSSSLSEIGVTINHSFAHRNKTLINNDNNFILSNLMVSNDTDSSLSDFINTANSLVNNSNNFSYQLNYFYLINLSSQWHNNYLIHLNSNNELYFIESFTITAFSVNLSPGEKNVKSKIKNYGTEKIYFQFFLTRN